MSKIGQNKLYLGQPTVTCHKPQGPAPVKPQSYLFLLVQTPHWSNYSKHLILFPFFKGS